MASKYIPTPEVLEKLDSMAASAEASGALPSFDEFVHMDSKPDTTPDNDNEESGGNTDQ